ncbi:MAG: molybdenum cofactor biosynthesis protein MoaE [Planctomycetota bacterium]
MIRVSPDPIDLAELHKQAADPSTGAVVVFVGVTRGETGGRLTTRLAYEAYESMAARELESLKHQAAQRWPLTACRLVHRVGDVPVGEASVAVLAASAHRNEAFEAARWLIDTLKESVPIWKQEHYADGSKEWQHPAPVETLERGSP